LLLDASVRQRASQVFDDFTRRRGGRGEYKRNSFTRFPEGCAYLPHPRRSMPPSPPGRIYRARAADALSFRKRTARKSKSTCFSSGGNRSAAASNSVRVLMRENKPRSRPRGKRVCICGPRASFEPRHLRITSHLHEGSSRTFHRLISLRSIWTMTR